MSLRCCAEALVAGVDRFLGGRDDHVAAGAGGGLGPGGVRPLVPFVVFECLLEVAGMVV